jgi:hypothetical protein
VKECFDPQSVLRVFEHGALRCSPERACWATTLSAGEVGERETATINTIVVAAKKISLADEEVKKQVETALHADAYFYDAQVTNWDLRTARRVARKIGGVKRIISERQICSSCDGGGGA